MGLIEPVSIGVFFFRYCLCLFEYFYSIFLLTGLFDELFAFIGWICHDVFSFAFDVGFDAISTIKNIIQGRLEDELLHLLLLFFNEPLCLLPNEILLVYGQFPKDIP